MKRDNKLVGADERNFRSSYYEKVGFRSVEEKRSLEIILKEKPLDRLRLRHFALRFSVPASLKNLVWKLLFGVVPVHLDSYDFVMQQRKQQYEDLKHGLGILGITFDESTKPNFFVVLWLLDSGKLKLDWRCQSIQLLRDLRCAVYITMWVVPLNFVQFTSLLQPTFLNWHQLTHRIPVPVRNLISTQRRKKFIKFRSVCPPGPMEEERYKSLTHISNSVMNMFESDVDIYWLSRGIFQYVDKFRGDISKLVQFTKSILEKEDNELYSFLLHIDAFTVLPINNWMQSCFANVITESSVGKIWDKLAAGSCKILVFVAVVLLMTLRRRILKCNTVAEVLECVNRISDEVADVIVSKAIEMWQQNGSSLASTNGLEFTKSPASTVWL